LKRSASNLLANSGRRPTQNLRATTPAAAREFVQLRDLADCLLEAYDSVTRRAYEKFMERNGQCGGELEDWLSSEREILLAFPVDLQESANYVYALATIPEPDGVRLAIGIESRWLVILANRHTDEAVAASQCRSKKLAALTSGARRNTRPATPERELIGISEFSKRIASHLPVPSIRSVPPSTAAPLSRAEKPRPGQTARILQLPGEVDSHRSVAVMSGGLLAIRMPKFPSAGAPSP
jgi:hypothetical protein